MFYNYKTIKLFISNSHNLSGSEGQKGQRGSKGDRGERGAKGEVGPMGPPAFVGNLPANLVMKSKPKVAFSVVSRLKLGPVASDTAIIFDTVFINEGNGFDSSTSKFICPVGGSYLFSAHILSQLQLDVYAWIMLNDKHQLPLHGNGRAGHGSDSQTIILPLKAGDKVWVLINKDSATFNDYSTFSGFLLYESEYND
ncbi:hypothetical protein HELRODRAFT_77797 [Helobdella robusta]|uniref:C1q domain-containing protein n=1 Tax=Helobdella robusta TaxID=6412 RepID=T1G342_HELRO|nr:hypothetical protein HELRODRAFT_77797 [Helobdella robusta]ESO05252.1 hypothetical protein HELRODRAFT_77797 [Helobdella robusta]